MTPQQYQARLDAATPIAIACGMRVFQGAMLDETERAHVRRLLRLMNPPANATVLDLGSGIGEVARLMRHERPDLIWVLVNSNALQLSLSPSDMATICCDYQDVPLEDACADGAMFLYSLCHSSDFRAALREAARLVRQGGFLFVYDYQRNSGDDELFERELNARALGRLHMEHLADAAGWDVEYWINPETDDRRFRELYANDAGYDRIFQHLVPCIWRAKRKP